MNSKISPSVMCADFFDLRGSINAFEQNGIEYIHVDIMDGHFVPNFTLGTDFVKKLKENTRIPLDIHLMVKEPEKKLQWFTFGEGDYVSVHIESTGDMAAALTQIHDRGAKAMIALSPDTPIDLLWEYIDHIEGVLIMTVHPGFAGQKLIPETLDKVAALRSELDRRGYGQIEIEVDGNVSFANAPQMRAAGADIFVAGTSSVFTKEMSMKDAISKLREVIQVGESK